MDARPEPGSSPYSGTLFVSLLAGLAGIAGSYAVAGATSGFVGVPVNAVVVNAMPAPVVTFSILFLGKVGEVVGFALALGIVLALLGAGTALALTYAPAPLSAAGAAAFGWALAAAVTGEPVTALGTAVPMGVVVGALERAAPPTPIRDSRRYLLKSVGGVLAFGGVAYLVGNRTSPASARDLGELPSWDAGRARTARERIRSRLAEAGTKSLDVEGLRGLVSDLDEFYEVDINTFNPTVNPDGWRLSVTGAVENELTLAYDELTAMEPEHRFVTLRCVSDPLNGKLVDNALWTGVPVGRLLDRAGPQGDHVVLRARDGYYEDFPLEAFEDGFLAYGMNGSVLPRKHGFPVRALVLGHWGEVNVKWLTGIEIHESEVLSYWEKRGWHGTGPVHTVAKLRTVNRLDDGRVQVAGHAYAGTRGVARVEVSVDGGDTWERAALSDPLDDADVWRQWAYDWEPTAASHAVVVRAVDGEGNVQPRERQKPHPSGATGWVRKTITA